MQDETHPTDGCFLFLRSGRGLTLPMIRTDRHKKSFVLNSIVIQKKKLYSQDSCFTCERGDWVCFFYLSDVYQNFYLYYTLYFHFLDTVSHKDFHLVHNSVTNKLSLSSLGRSCLWKAILAMTPRVWRQHYGEMDNQDAEQ